MLSDRSKVLIVVGSAAVIVFFLAWAGVFQGVDAGEILLAAFIIAFVLLRWWLGCVIGRAAEKRRCGRTGWVIFSLLGPLIVWMVYLIFVHWRPVVTAPGIEQTPSA